MRQPMGYTILLDTQYSAIATQINGLPPYYHWGNNEQTLLALNSISTFFTAVDATNPPARLYVSSGYTNNLSRLITINFPSDLTFEEPRRLPQKHIVLYPSLPNLIFLREQNDIFFYSITA